MGKRAWRGNARGVDLNRNFPVGWAPPPPGEVPESKGWAGQTHPGKFPFRWAHSGWRAESRSEPCTKALRRLLERVRPHLTLDLHTFGSQVLRPPAHPQTTVAPEVEAVVKEVGDTLAAALGYVSLRGCERVNGRTTSADEVEAVAEDERGRGGTMIDWIASDLGLPALLVELGTSFREDLEHQEHVARVLREQLPLLVAKIPYDLPERAASTRQRSAAGRSRGRGRGRGGVAFTMVGMDEEGGETST